MEKDSNLLEEGGLILKKQEPMDRSLVIVGSGGYFSGLGIITTGSTMNLNVRSGGGANHSLVGSLPNGAVVRVGRYSGDPAGWVRIEFHVTASGSQSTSYRGRWISSAYLTNGRDIIGFPTLKAYNTNMVTTTSGLRVRRWPDASVSNNIITTLPNRVHVRSYYVFGRNNETFGGGYRDRWHYIGQVNPNDPGG